jgi:ATP-dependent Clp protease adaptor protein ClpS
VILRLLQLLLRENRVVAMQRAVALFLRPIATIFNATPVPESPERFVVNLLPFVMSGQNGPGDRDGEGQVITKTRPKTQRPPLYKVLLLNDDYTPMEFVVHVLERFFGLTHAQSFDIMLTVHKKGLAVVGVFSFEVAETKVAQVMDFARRHQHPLQCTMEKE